MKRIFTSTLLILAVLFSGSKSLNAQSNILVNNNDGATATSYFTQSTTNILAFGNHVLIAFNDAGSFPASNLKFTGFAYSSDGGATFTDGGTLPLNSQGDAGEPVLARDTTTGRIYLATVQISGVGINIFHSDDNGITWTLPVNGAPGESVDDTPWMVVDNFSGSGNGNVYLATTSFGSGQNVYFFKSTDQGATFGPSGGVLLTNVNAPEGAHVTVGPDHSIYVFWYETISRTIKMRKSSDLGATFGAAVTVVSGLLDGNDGPNGDLALTGIPQGTSTAAHFRSNEFPAAAVNPVSGHIYVTYDNYSIADKANVFFAMSTDGGSTWSSPTKVNDDATTTDQWEPTIAVTPDGSRLGIFYYSRQEDANNNLFKYYSRMAGISGSTINFETSSAVSNVASYPEFGRDGFVISTYMTDFNHAVATENGFYVSWFDARDDLAGGAPRKDPNVYFSFFPVTGPVQNHCPTAQPISLNVSTGTAIKFLLQGSDADNDPLTYTISQAPSNGTAAIVGGDSILYTPTAGYSGADQLKYKVSDGKCEAEATVDITIVVCPQGLGYWKNNPNVWPASATPMMLGSKSYTKAQLITILNTSPGNGNGADASILLAHQLIAAKLSIANGTSGTSIASTITHADGLLAAYSGFLPYNVRTNTTAGHAMVVDAGTLGNFNSGSMTQGCGQPALISTNSNNIIEEQQTPAGFKLEQNYPNPFGSGTIIRYELPVSSHVKLEVFNLAGEKIATLVDGFENAGYKTIYFNEGNRSGGIYYYRLTAGKFSETKKMILIK